MKQVHISAKQYREALERPRFTLGWREYRVAMIALVLVGLLLRLAFYARHW